MVASAAPFPTLEHALAALDAFPISGSLQVGADDGADFDAIDRARLVLTKAWRADVPLRELRLTPQGGVLLAWERPGWALELTVDPFSVYDFRLDTPEGLNDWTRAATEAAIADVTVALTAMVTPKR
ncbi:MAG TPA: hypothetical protein VFZ11_13230 [Gemmatimonadaceae bacterium]